MSLDQKVKQRKSAKSKTVVPYHLFTVLGEHFVFDTSGCQFYRITPMMFDLLELCLDHSLVEAEKIMHENNKYATEEIKHAVAELALISTHGLFKRHKNYINRQAAEKEFSKIFPPNKVGEIELILAEHCNLACKYCYCRVTRNPPPDKLMSLEITQKAIDFLMKQNNDSGTITLFGGEPLLNKSVIDFVMDYSPKQAKDCGKTLRFVITTNATLLDDKTINYIVRHNFGLMVSLDGPKELHDNQCPTRSGGGSFETAANNIKKIMKSRTVGVRATMTHPMPDLRGLVNFFSDFGFSIMTLGPATNRTESPSPVDFTLDDFFSLAAQQEEMLPEMVDALKNKKKPKYFPDSKFFSIIEDGAISPRTRAANCSAGHAKIAVDPDGILYPCTKYCGMDNWQVGSLAQGVDHAKVRSMWLDFLKCIQPQCGTCWAYSVCGGPCIWDCSQNDGSFKFNELYCFSRIRGIERAAYMYFQLEEHLSDVDISDLKEPC